MYSKTLKYIHNDLKISNGLLLYFLNQSADEIDLYGWKNFQILEKNVL